MASTSMHPAFARFLLILVATLSRAAHALPVAASCLPEERDALLAFKDGISSDPGGVVASWQRGGQEDCCRWRGIRCSNNTGHVLALRLRNVPPGPELDDRGYYAGTALVGRISPSLLSLSRLRHLDLSRNYLEGSPDAAGCALPAFLGGLRSLRYLNLSGIYFSGEVPPQIGNLSRLHTLDLSSDFDARLMRSSDLSWLERLPLLQHLSLSSVDLSRARDWHRAVNMLPALRTLRLSSCSLPASVHQSNPPLLFRNFTNLEELDLSMNQLEHPAAPSWFWNLTSLTSLNLMGTLLYGQLPDSLDAMVSLEILDFSYNGNMATMPRSLKNLCNLRYLDLDSSLADGVDIGEMLESLPQRCSSSRLQELYLPNNGMSGNLPDYRRLMHLTGLRVLDLSYNNITGYIPPSLGNLTSLATLDISSNNLTGLIPTGQGYFPSLSTLVLSSNYLTGNIPAEIVFLASLITLDLGDNYLTGPVPSQISMLSNLTYLDLSLNALVAVVTEEHLASFVNLKKLDLSQNLLVKVEVNSKWKPPFSLHEASFASCFMGPLFPGWLQWQVELFYLDISSTGINDRLPDWFSSTFSKVVDLDISNNSLYGELPGNMEAMSLVEAYLSLNKLTGHVPRLPRNITVLDISMNSLSGPLPSLGASRLRVLILFSNRIVGHLPVSICEARSLAILDLANNLLMGELPSCSAMEGVRYLLLSNNSFSGTFPPFVQSCTSLGFLDLAWNSLTGTLPMWIGNLMQLQFLRLSHNMFTGKIPIVITKLKLLHHLNLAGNDISGSIPRGLSNLTAMTQKAGKVGSFPYQGYADVVGEYGNSLSAVTKGQDLNYGVGILQMVSIDLSFNSLTGIIPEEIAFLDALLNINLSWNHLSGKIPDNIGAIKSLESLDLSKNMLSGEIPSSLSSITYLSFLNLSQNNLTGRIPPGSQLDTLYQEHPSIYDGNSGLCGPPLQKICLTNATTKQDGQKRSKHGFEPMSFYFGLGLGLMLGLWLVFCILLFKKAWRIAYFRLFDKLYDQIYVLVVVKWNSLTRAGTAN